MKESLAGTLESFVLIVATRELALILLDGLEVEDKAEVADTLLIMSERKLTSLSTDNLQRRL